MNPIASLPDFSFHVPFPFIFPVFPFLSRGHLGISKRVKDLMIAGIFHFEILCRFVIESGPCIQVHRKTYPCLMCLSGWNYKTFPL